MKFDLGELALFCKSHFPGRKGLTSPTDNSTQERNMGGLRGLALRGQVLLRLFWVNKQKWEITLLKLYKY